MFSNKILCLIFLLVQQINFIRSDCVHGEHYPHLSDCRLFYQCSHGQLFELRCPEGLHFNPIENVCDFPENVNCEFVTETPSTTMTTADSTTTTPSTSIPTTSIPTTSIPTTSIPTTSIPTTSIPTTSIPTTSTPSTTQSTTTTSVPQTCRWNPGQKIVKGTRCDVKHGFFQFQFDGNAVIYDINNKPVWNTETGNGLGHNFVFQTDGNLVMYSSAGNALWNSNSQDRGGSLLIFQDDRNLVIYNSKTVAL